MLGQLVDGVFEKMTLAGDAGSLLKINEEIAGSVAEAKRQWLRGATPDQAVLFPDLVTRRPEPQSLFDVTEITADEFWDQAEDRILAALKNYTEESTMAAPFAGAFAGDAARGFAFIDVCRRRCDVVLMNPPFGEFCRRYKAHSRIAYPNSYNEHPRSFRRTLAPSSRAPRTAWRDHVADMLFLASFTDWRKKAILSKGSLGVVADLGQGVMDNAMVEAAAYTLERSRPPAMTPFIRRSGAEPRGDHSWQHRRHQLRYV